MIKNNYEIIKAIVERKSKCNDLSIEGVYKGLSLTRFVYYKLCQDYMKNKYSHTDAAKAIKRGHNNALRSIKKYEELYYQEFFKYYKSIYIACSIELLELEVIINSSIIEFTRTMESNEVPY